MKMNPERVFGYLKAALTEDAPVDVQLTGEDDLLMRPFVGGLFMTLAYDAEDRFHLLQRRHLAELGMNERELFKLGMANLEGLVACGAVQVHQCRAAYAVIAGGDFDASLLLVESVWEWVSHHGSTSETTPGEAPVVDVQRLKSPPATPRLLTCNV